jgi:sugar phosphate isomerase/epimerase
MQIAVMGHCLNALLPSDQRSVEDRVRVAAETGITHVEPFGGTWPAEVDPRRTAEVVRQEGDRRGVAFPAFGSNTRLGEPGVGAGLVPAPRAGTSLAPTLAVLKREVDACQILGATVLTTAAIDAQPVTTDAAAGFGLPFERAIGGLLEPLRELAEYAAERGVRIAVLNHCALVYLSWHQEWLIRLADHPAAGAAVDPGNYLYYGGEDPLEATRRLASHAALVRIGDWRPRTEAAVREEFARSGRLSLWESAPLGEGVVDHGRCLHLLRTAGYQGVVSLKSPGPPIPDAHQALRRAVERLRDWREEA